MERENISELTNREEACKRVKQIAEVMKRLKINNYLKIGGISQEDKNALAILESDMDTIARRNGLQKLATELKTTMSARYDIIDSEKSGQTTKVNGQSISNDNNLGFNKDLEAYRGAVDAETQALKTGKLSKAIECQTMAQKYMNILDDDNKKRAIEYKRELFLELNFSLTKSEDNVEKWMRRFQNCLRPEDFSNRINMAKKLDQMTKGCEKTNGEKYAGSIDRSI